MIGREHGVWGIAYFLSISFGVDSLDINDSSQLFSNLLMFAIFLAL